MADFTDVYDRTASTYSATWDGHVPTALEQFAARCADTTVLDVGCGPGRDLTAFASLGVHAVGVDQSAGMVARAVASGHQALRGDLAALCFPNGAFGGIWAYASLVHLDNDAVTVALTELARVTTAGGAAHITVKAATHGKGRDGWEGAGEDARWFRYWNLAEFSELTERCGWRCNRAYLEADTRRGDLDWVTVTLTRA